MDTVRLVLLGSGGVGKSCITIRYVQGSFMSEYDPITSADSYRRQVEVAGQPVMLEILDTATERFTAMRDFYMKNDDGFILVYSIIARSTFDDLPDLRRQVLQVKDRDEVPMVLVGNKCDADDHRQVRRDEAQRLADRWGSSVRFFETSAKQNLRVSDVFADLTRRVLDEKRGGKEKQGRTYHKDGSSSKCTLF